MLRLLGWAAAVTLVLVEFVLTLGVGANTARLLGLRGGIAPRVAAPRAPMRCSFSASTAVVLADGTTKPIADVRVGDRVLAADPETGDRGVRNITHVWRHEDVLVDLETSDGAVVSTTEDHPFWNATDRQWQPAVALDPGDRLLTTTGTPLTVDGLDLATADAGVAYNLTVADLHTYYVGVGDHTALVHNTCWADAGISTTKHFRQQMAARKVNPEHALHTFKHGDTYWDKDTWSFIRYDRKSKLAVAIDPHDLAPRTVFRGPVKPRWVRYKSEELKPPVPKKGRKQR
jgi:hypothetical protein